MIAAEILTAAAGAVVTAAPAALLLRRAYDRLRAVRQAYDLARYDATHDGLTGLENRRAFYEHAAHAVATAGPDRPMALALVDVDGFKAVNDTYGHGVGDLVLLSVAHELAKRVPDGLLARLGGDEFVALVPLSAGVSALTVGEALLDASDSVDVDDAAVCVTFSVGVAELFEPTDLTEALTCADAAMYRAKQGYGNGVQVFLPVRDDHTVPVPAQRTAIRTRDLSTTDEPATHRTGAVR